MGRTIDLLSEEELEEIVDEEGNITLDPNRKYTPGELDDISTLYLRKEIRNGRASLRGENPILFEDHLKSRRRREILNSLGVPDPSFVSGMYYRTHPRGRKVNSPEQRKKFGASYYR